MKSQKYIEKTEDRNYIIKVKPIDGRPPYILNTVLTGRKETLMNNLKKLDYIQSIGLDSSIFFHRWELIPEEEHLEYRRLQNGSSRTS